jgi:hypothetical protein
MDLGALLGVALGSALAIAGGIVGQIMQGRREHRKWVSESRKEEFRELLDVLTTTMMLTVWWHDTDPTSAALGKEWQTAWNEALRVIHTRLFIKRNGS